MIEYVQERVRLKNFTVFTVINLTERVGTMSLLEIESTFNLFDLNVQNKLMSSERNSSTGFFSLRVSNLGRHERYGY